MILSAKSSKKQMLQVGPYRWPLSAVETWVRTMTLAPVFCCTDFCQEPSPRTCTPQGSRSQLYPLLKFSTFWFLWSLHACLLHLSFDLSIDISYLSVCERIQECVWITSNHVQTNLVHTNWSTPHAIIRRCASGFRAPLSHWQIDSAEFCCFFKVLLLVF